MTPLHTALLHGSVETSRLLAFQRNIKIASPSLAVSILIKMKYGIRNSEPGLIFETIELELDPV